MAQAAAFKYHSDLLELRDLFYNDESSTKALERAVALTSLWLAREAVPHGVTSTSTFISTKLLDAKLRGREDIVLRSAYSMAFIRFVNGLLDPFQQGTYATALVEIAKKIQLPYSFVEIRHLATHNQLPSLELLREMTELALDWLWEHYWLMIEPSSSRNRSREMTPIVDPHVSTRRVYDLLKGYRLLVKEGKPMEGDCSIEIMRIAESPKTAYKLVNLLIRHWIKLASFKASHNIYKTLLEHLPPSFLYQLILAIISFEAENGMNSQFDSKEEWAGYLLQRLRLAPFPFKYFITFTSEDELMGSISTQLTQLNPSSKLVKVLRDNNGPKAFKRPALLDEILLDSTPPLAEEKDEKRARKRRLTFPFFETHEVWNQTPFGIVPDCSM